MLSYLFYLSDYFVTYYGLVPCRASQARPDGRSPSLIHIFLDWLWFIKLYVPCSKMFQMFQKSNEKMLGLYCYFEYSIIRFYYYRPAYFLGYFGTLEHFGTYIFFIFCYITFIYTLSDVMLHYAYALAFQYLFLLLLVYPFQSLNPNILYNDILIYSIPQL